MSGKRAKKNKKKQVGKTIEKAGNKKKFGLIIVAILIAAITGLVLFNLTKSGNTHKKPHKKSKISLSKLNNDNKSLAYCLKLPEFPKKHGLKPPYAIDLRQGSNENMGLKIIEPRRNGKALRLPGWQNFGFLGLYTLDNFGNIYTAPMPYVSIDINPPKEQNKILKVDAKSGEMKEFLRLPSKNTPTSKNPFGVIGLAFDCESKSLYATSIAGSTYKEEAGKLFQIDNKDKKILNTYDNIDVMGIAIFKGASGKRMYLGLARKPEVYSIGLNEKGGFNDDLRFEFSLIDVPGGGDYKAHRIKIANGMMTLKTREFSYTLIAASTNLRVIYTFKYNVDKDKWEFVDLRNE